jgi:hypothetical protein
MCDFSVILLVAVYQARMVECSVGETHTSIHPFPSSLVSWLEAAAAIFAGAKTFGRLKVIDRVHWDTSTFHPCLSYIHSPCNPTTYLSPPFISFSVDAGEQCRRSSAPPRPARRRRLRLPLVVVLLPHQHHLRNLRQNRPTSRSTPRILPIPPLNRHQPQHPLRNRRLRLPNNRPCDSPLRDNMCDSQIL